MQPICFSSAAHQQLELYSSCPEDLQTGDTNPYGQVVYNPVYEFSRDGIQGPKCCRCEAFDDKIDAVRILSNNHKSHEFVKSIWSFRLHIKTSQKPLTADQNEQLVHISISSSQQNFGNRLGGRGPLLEPSWQNALTVVAPSIGAEIFSDGRAPATFGLNPEPKAAIVQNVKHKPMNCYNQKAFPSRAWPAAISCVYRI